jgi:hypothetical protein
MCWKILNVLFLEARADIVDGNESCETHITLCGQQMSGDEKLEVHKSGKL